MNGAKPLSVRFDAPFTFKCLACGQVYMFGTKFKAKKLSPELYQLNCMKCKGKVTFRRADAEFACDSGCERFGVQKVTEDDLNSNSVPLEKGNTVSEPTDPLSSESASFDPPQFVY